MTIKPELLTGAEFKALREKAGLTVYRLYKLTKVAQNIIHRYEKGGNITARVYLILYNEIQNHV